MKGGVERKGNDPQGASELHGGCDTQGLVAIGRPGTDYGARIVDGDGGPGAELLLGEPKQMAQRREEEKCHSVQHEDGG